MVMAHQLIPLKVLTEVYLKSLPSPEIHMSNSWAEEILYYHLILRTLTKIHIKPSHSVVVHTAMTSVQNLETHVNRELIPKVHRIYLKEERDRGN